MTVASAHNQKPVKAPTLRDRERHRRTTQLVRASLLTGVRYGKHGPSRNGVR